MKKQVEKLQLQYENFCPNYFSQIYFVLVMSQQSKAHVKVTLVDLWVKLRMDSANTSVSSALAPPPDAPEDTQSVSPVPLTTVIGSMPTCKCIINSKTSPSATVETFPKI